MAEGIYGPGRGLKSKAIREIEKLVEANILSPEEARWLAYIRRPREDPREHALSVEERLIACEKDGVTEGFPFSVVAGMVASRIHDIPTVREVIEWIMRGAEEIIDNLKKLKE
ncbi:MAG: hypothetical protein ACTSP1_16355 [Candidatus Freyarchaeota archaeon]|nr:hypothetical protein [Deltaproteobacteria bacterium]